MADPIIAEPNSTNPNSMVSETLFEQPYKKLLPEFQALTLDELVQVNLDITTSVTTVLGALPEILGFVPRIAEELPKFDIERLKRLDDYAMAMSHAQTLYVMASQPTDGLQPLAEEGTKLREKLYTDVTALVNRGHLDGNRIADLKGPVGYKNLAIDLQILAAVLRESYPRLEGKCATPPEDIPTAERLAAGILRNVGLKEQGTAAVAATSEMRVRAFTLFTRVYDQTRRAITYLRWNEDDVDSIAPSLYAGRGGRKKTGTDIPPKPVTPNAPATGVTNPAGTSHGAASSVPGADGSAKPLGTGSGGPFV